MSDDTTTTKKVPRVAAKVTLGQVAAMTIGHVLLPLMIVVSSYRLLGSFVVAAVLLACVVSLTVVIVRAARSRVMTRRAQALLLASPVMMCATVAGTLLTVLVLP